MTRADEANAPASTAIPSLPEPTSEGSRSPELAAFRHAVTGGAPGLWSWDVDCGLLVWSTSVTTQSRAAPRADGIIRLSATDLTELDGDSIFGPVNRVFREQMAEQLELRDPRTESEPWIEVSITPLTRDGRVTHVLGTWRDTTERLRLLREVGHRSRQQEILSRLGERALVERDLQVFFDEAVTALQEMLDVELVKILELLPGETELLLRAGTGWSDGKVGHARVSTGRDSQAGYTLAAGRPVIVDQLAAETRFTGQPLLHDHQVVSGVTAPIAGQDGKAYGVLGVHTRRQRKFADYDVSFIGALANVLAGAIQRWQLDRRHELMIRELRHRSGNLFAQLLALFSQTAKSSRSIADLVTKYEARVLALANAHRLVTEGGWKSTSLNELLGTLLAPYRDRMTLEGADVLLEPDPTLGLSMALHELATNALRHGALSRVDGHVSLRWHVASTRQGLTLVLDWIESGSPYLKRPRQTGFGSRLISMVVERQLNGTVQQTFSPSGLQVVLSVPLTADRWHRTS